MVKSLKKFKKKVKRAPLRKIIQGNTINGNINNNNNGHRLETTISSIAEDDDTVISAFVGHADLTAKVDWDVDEEDADLNAEVDRNVDEEDTSDDNDNYQYDSGSSDDSEPDDFFPVDEDLEPEDRTIHHGLDRSSERVDLLKEILDQLKFRTHLQCAAGGLKTEVDINTLYGRLSKFILWSLYRLNGDVNIEISVVSVKLLLVQICSTHFGVLAEYCTAELELTFNYKASTIINHILDLVGSMQWFVLYRVELDHVYNLTPSSLLGFTTIASNLRRYYSRCAKHESRSKSMDDAIIAKKMPSGGLTELQNALKSQSSIIKKICETVELKKLQFQIFMGVLYSTMYSYSAQGRIGGFEHIRFNQYQALRDRNHATTDKFKSRLAFGLQAVTASPEALELLHLYVTIIRPKISSNVSHSEDNKLFLSFNGNLNNILF
jgi:hypothetical protein